MVNRHVSRPIAGGTNDGARPARYDYWRTGYGACEQAALDFVTWCGPCHGRTGVGDGPVAASLTTKPSDLTLLKQRAGGEFQPDEVFKRVDGRDFPSAHGTPEMPVWGYWFKLQETAAGLLQEDVQTAEKEVRKRIQRLVEYLETIQK